MLSAGLALFIRAGLVISIVGAGCTSQTSTPSPTSVDPATASASSGVLTVKVGAIVNTTAPTAERDERVVGVLGESAVASTANAAVSIEIIRIDEVNDVPAAVTELVERGVTVIMALCDDATVPAIVEASLAAEVLAVTGCVTIPRPPLIGSDPLFIDLAGVPDSGAAMAEWGALRGVERVATIRSDLVPDVARTCSDIEGAIADLDISLDASTTFTELVDDPKTVVESVSPLLIDTEAIMLCALPPTSGDMVAALRSAGFRQPIALPWFADPQNWTAATSDVFVIAPASRYGDDPLDAVDELLASLGPDAQAVDVITADTVAVLASAAQTAGSVGSTRLATSIRGREGEVVSGELHVSVDDALVARTYRSISVVDGEPRFDELITPRRTPR